MVRPPRDEIVRAARILRDGGLVAFPTETVYGLGADASNESAVRHLFAVKGRPRDHPVIVHIGERVGDRRVGDGRRRTRRALSQRRSGPGP